MEFQEQEEQEEEMGIPEPPSYDSFGNMSKLGGAVGTEGAATTIGRKSGTIKYKECQKNHAVSFGGHAVDGCCEFIAAGEEGTLEAVICAACNCHRNFHRKEIDGEFSPYNRPQPPPPPPQMHHHHQILPYYHRGPTYPSASGYLHHHLVSPMSQHRPLALPAAAAASGGGMSREEEDMSIPSSSGGGGTRKRFRTKFTQEQKEKMLAFAEQVGWRIQKDDEAAVEQFCVENCVKRNVLKVWMHNNKNSLDELRYKSLCKS
ncbi:putative transcription factor ZF-HD family [Lupinus albus]|uniref:Putative transcription factor ZF-HD family n=1 Tax=Lupinus albus TaxID=3870 RepID=A0A6A4P318_LUPAL|nr:putative transcription factor ZF-HD family [Lupinus albus]